MFFHIKSSSGLTSNRSILKAPVFSAAIAFLLAGLFSISSHAANICIGGGDSETLDFWLNTMSDNNQDDEIRLRAGTFNLPSSGIFQFFSSEPHSLTISGRWNAGCTSTRGVADTILNGSGIGRIMRLYNEEGDLTVRRLLFVNGRRVGDSGSAGLQVNGLAGFGRDVTVELSGFFNNADDGVGFDNGSGGLSAATENGVVRVRNNLFVDNAGGMASAASIFLNGATSIAYVTSNTASSNGGPGAVAGGFRVDVGTAPVSSLFISNNILWGNSSPDLQIANGSVLYFNDIEQLVGTPSILSAGNVSVDPGFSGGAPPSFRLMASSPLVNAGLNNAPGGLTTVDFEGYSRIEGGTVDMGAYELFDRIFADGFD